MQEIRVARNDDEEVGAVVVGLDCGRGRAVVPKLLLDGRNPRGASLREVQLLEKVAQAAVAITACTEQVRLLDGLLRDAAIGASVTEYADGMRLHGDLHRFALLVIAVIERIDHGLFDGLVGVIEMPDSFGRIRHLADPLLDDHKAEIIQGGADHRGDGARDSRRFHEVVGVAHRPLRK